MTIQALDHVGVVVRDLDQVSAFFRALGFEIGTPFEVGGEWVDRIVGLEGTRARVVYVSTPGGGGNLELIQFLTPPTPTGETNLPANTQGFRHVALRVTNMDAMVAKVRAAGYWLVGEVVQHETYPLLVYVRGPEGLIIELSQPLQTA